MSSLFDKVRGKQPKELLAKPDGKKSSVNLRREKLGKAEPTYGIEVSYLPSSSESIIADVVFIHGLNGDRTRSWTAPGQTEPWPVTLLPHKIPRTRILSWGYSASPTGLGQNIQDYGNQLVLHLQSTRESTESVSRPIIFVAHSFGGLVLKAAMVSSDSRAQELFDATCGIIFISTPHAGSQVYDSMTLVTRMMGIFTPYSADRSVAQNLSRNYLQELSDQFMRSLHLRLRQENEIKITCFYETRATGALGLVVPKLSAVLPGYESIGIDATHPEVNKFASSQDPGFLSIANTIARWCHETQLQAPAALSRLSDNFDTRQAKIECLKSLVFAEMGSRQSQTTSSFPESCTWILSAPEYAQWRQPSTSMDALWIKGRPGSGKSTIMQYLILEHVRQSYTSDTVCLVFFFNARGAPLEKSAVGLYRALLHQLLKRCDGLLDHFTQLYLRKAEASGISNFDWKESELSSYFHEMIAKPHHLSWEIFIDALDECSETQIQSIVDRFEDSLRKSRSTNTKLRLCWATRDKGLSQRGIKGGLYLNLDNRTDVAIRAYVKEKLILENQALTMEVGDLIVRSSLGNLLWVVLVVSRVLEASLGGNDPKPQQLRKLVLETPKTLNGAYEATFRTMDSDRLVMKSIHVLQWMLFASRPLKLYELFVAGQFSARTSPKSVEELLLSSESSIQSPQRLNNFESSLSRQFNNLVQVVNLEGTKVVQFFHVSVRDFLLSPEGIPLLGFKTLNELSTKSSTQLSQVCMDCLGIKVFRNPLPELDESVRLSPTELVDRCFEPLDGVWKIFDLFIFDYVLIYMFDHMEMVDDMLVDPSTDRTMKRTYYTRLWDAFEGIVRQRCRLAHNKLIGPEFSDDKHTLATVISDTASLMLGNKDISRSRNLEGLSPLVVGGSTQSTVAGLTHHSFELLAPEYRNAEFCSIRLRMDWEVADLMCQNFVLGTEIGSVLVLNERGKDAQSVTCLEYLTQTWPKTGTHVLGILETALIDLVQYYPIDKRGFTSRRIIYDDVHLQLVWKGPSKSHRGEDLSLQATGPPHLIAELLETLGWLAAALRHPLSEGIATSKVKIDCKHIWPQLPLFDYHIHLAPLQPLVQKVAPCWHSLYKKTVIVHMDEIDAAARGQGLEISLERMVNLAAAENIINYDGGVILMGFSNILVPHAKLGDGSIQWHLLTGPEDQLISRWKVKDSGFIPLEMSAFDEVKSAPRHYLGTWPNANIVLGTKDAMYAKLMNSDLRVKKRDMRLASITTGLSVGVKGIVTFTGSTTWAVAASQRKNNGAQMDVGQLLNNFTQQMIILYDPHEGEKRAWLVPAISVMLHMVHLRAKESNFSQENIPYAKLPAPDGKAAWDAIEGKLDNIILNMGATDESSFNTRLGDVLKSMALCLWNIEPRPSGDLTTPRFEGYDFADIARQSPSQDLKQSAFALRSLNEGWFFLTSSVPVLLCRGLGDLILPEHPSSNRHATLKKGQDLLAAPLTCLEQLSSRAGQALSTGYLTDDWVWHSPHAAFGECECGRVDCDRIQYFLRWKVYQKKFQCPKSVSENLLGAIVISSASIQEPTKTLVKGLLEKLKRRNSESDIIR